MNYDLTDRKTEDWKLFIWHIFAPKLSHLRFGHRYCDDNECVSAILKPVSSVKHARRPTLTCTKQLNPLMIVAGDQGIHFS